MELKDTIKLMSSDNHRDRFIAEYWQTKIRYENLHKMCVKYEAEILDFAPVCPLELLNRQASHMGMYLKTLEVRAEIEGISLDV